MSVKVYRADLHGDPEDVDEADRASECSSVISTSKSKREPVVINGPYSSCARYVFDCKHVGLVASGIGITPYASILSSLMAQFRASRRSEERRVGKEC